MEFTEQGYKVINGRTTAPIATRLHSKTKTGINKYKIVLNYAYIRAMEAVSTVCTTQVTRELGSRN